MLITHRLAPRRQLRSGAGLLVEQLIDLFATFSGDLSHAPQPPQRSNRGANHVVRVRASQAFRQDVMDAGALDDGPHRSAGDDAGSGGSRLQKNAPASEVAERLMRNGHAVERHAKHVLARLVVTLPNGFWDFVRLSQSNADVT